MLSIIQYTFSKTLSIMIMSKGGHYNSNTIDDTYHVRISKFPSQVEPAAFNAQQLKFIQKCQNVIYMINSL